MLLASQIAHLLLLRNLPLTTRAYRSYQIAEPLHPGTMSVL